MKLYGWLALLALMLAAQSAHATLYRWVDENGRVQYSDKPPLSAAPKGVSTLDSQGMVRKSPPQPENPEETARRLKAQQDQQDQQRRDRALLQSFSNTKEIDLLRDRQIDAVNGAIQTNQSRRQSAQAKIEKLNKQISSFNKAKKSGARRYERRNGRRAKKRTGGYRSGRSEKDGRYCCNQAAR